MLWLDGESLSDESFCNFHKMEKLELLSECTRCYAITYCGEECQEED